MQSCRHQSRKVSHVHQEIRSHTIGNGSETLKINGTRIGRAARNNQLWLVLLRQFLHRVIINTVTGIIHAVIDRLEPLARLIGRRAMREMSARRQTHAHDGVPRLQQ